MDPKRVVQELLDITGLNQAELGTALGVTQSTISRWMRGMEPGGQARDKIASYARKIGAIKTAESLERDTVPIVGYVGAGGTVLYSEGQGPFGEAPMPPGGTAEGVVAVEVRGDSMSGQLENGWLVYYDTKQDPPTDDLHNRLCVIGLADGRVLIKRLLPGRKDKHYDLYSANGGPLMDQHVTWAARVLWIQPK